MEPSDLCQIFSIKGYAGVTISSINGGRVYFGKCPACNKDISEIKLQGIKAIARGPGSKWPDIMGTWDAIILHERVLDTLYREKLSGFIAHEMEIVEVKNKKLRDLPTPKYYIMEITGRFDIDWNMLDDVGGSVCPLCFYRNAQKENEYRFREKHLIPLIETWDGGVFLKTRNLRNGTLYCSKRFVELACEHKWTNFFFGDSIPRVGLWRNAPERCISYWDPMWAKKVEESVRKKYADLLELKKTEPTCEKEPISQKTASSAETHKESGEKSKLTYEEQLVRPEWEIVEKHFDVQIPQILKEFYQDPSRILKFDFRLQTKEEVEDKYFIDVAGFRPVNADVICEIEDENDLFYLASDGAGGAYLFDPTESDPEVILMVDFCDYYETGLKLSEFLDAPRLPQEK